MNCAVRSALLGCLLPLVLAARCGGDGGTSTAQDFGVDGISPEILVPGSQLTLKGQGFPLALEGSLTIQLEGTAGSVPLKAGGSAEVLDSGTALLTLPGLFIDQLISSDTVFEGTLTATRRFEDSKGKDEATLPIELRAQSELTPELAALSPVAFALGDTVLVEGDGFLLASEGQTVLRLSGQFKVDSPPGVEEIPQVAIPLQVSDRQHASFSLTPDKLSLYPGVFQGVASAVNYMNSEAELESGPLPLSLTLLPVTIDSMDPTLLRRGQYFSVSGRGFLPNDPVGEVATILELQGQLTTLDGAKVSLTGKDSVVLFPDSFTANTDMTFVLRVTLNSDGKPEGFGLVPGTFSGTATPVVFYGSDSYRGESLDVEFQIAQPLQVVYVKFLPSFDDAFFDFGLHEVREEIKERIIERAQWFYNGINIAFVSERPADFAEYSVIELAGEDPNGQGLLGLDNTTGKDTGNVRFDDVIGGKNAETEEQGYYAYGGVFLHSFLGFSPTLGGGAEALASPRFDDILEPFCPDLAGQPVEADEVGFGPRAEQIQEAIRVMGNLIGGTVAHEIGHSLGLANVPGHPEEYHNLGDNPGWLMDAGSARPFLERAELDGQGPEFFEDNSLEYLRSILPQDNANE